MSGSTPSSLTGRTCRPRNACCRDTEAFGSMTKPSSSPGAATRTRAATPALVLAPGQLQWPSRGLGKVHAAQQVLKARVGAQAIEPWFDLQKYHPCSALPVGHFQATKRFV